MSCHDFFCCFPVFLSQICVTVGVKNFDPNIFVLSIRFASDVSRLLNSETTAVQGWMTLKSFVYIHGTKKWPILSWHSAPCLPCSNRPHPRLITWLVSCVETCVLAFRVFWCHFLFAPQSFGTLLELLDSCSSAWPLVLPSKIFVLFPKQPLNFHQNFYFLPKIELNSVCMCVCADVGVTWWWVQNIGSAWFKGTALQFTVKEAHSL